MRRILGTVAVSSLAPIFVISIRVLGRRVDDRLDQPISRKVEESSKARRSHEHLSRLVGLLRRDPHLFHLTLDGASRGKWMVPKLRKRLREQRNMQKRLDTSGFLVLWIC